MFGSFFVEGSIGRINQEVIHVDDKPSFSNHVMKGVVHEPLEGCGGVGESEEHDSGFEQPLMSDEGCFPLVFIFDSYIIVSPADIKLGKDFGILWVVNEIRDQGKGVGVTDGMFVDVAVVLTGTKSSILLFDEEEGRCLWGVRWTDFSRGEVFT